MVAVIGGLMLLFYVLAQFVPDNLLLPLYCMFTFAGMGVALHERRKIGVRRGALERELEKERLRGPVGKIPWGEKRDEGD
jgi:hypothetical protein